jgi:protein phosphatase methylesterase 1
MNELLNSLSSSNSSLHKDYSPVSWNNYFDTQFTIPFKDKSIQIYSTNTSNSNSKNPLIIFHHGAGHSSLSFALVASKLKLLGLSCLAFDARGHGNTSVEINWELNTLSNDLLYILDHVENQEIILVGHSLGGSVCVDTISKIKNDKVDSVSLIKLKTLNESL